MKPFEHTLVRRVGVRPPIAFAWLTDYREDDPRWVFADQRASRSCERLDAASLHVRTVARFTGIRTTIDLVVTLLPPDAWRGDGDIKPWGLRLLRQETHWKVEPDGGDGTRLTARFVITPQNLVARLVLGLLGSRIRAELDAAHDRIATTLTTGPLLTPAPVAPPQLGVGEEPA
jgi:hypothetical protein